MRFLSPISAGLLQKIRYSSRSRRRMVAAVPLDAGMAAKAYKLVDGGKCGDENKPREIKRWTGETRNDETTIMY